MLIKLLFLILGAALISELVPKNKLPVLWSLFSSTAVLYFIYRLSLIGLSPEIYINYPWLKIPNLSVNLEIVINAANIYLVFALLLLSLLVLIQNTFGRETAKNSVNGLVLLNLLSTLMLVFAGNYMQMIVAVGVCDVLVFSSIDNVEAKKKYIYANFLADIGLLSIFAVILGQGGGLELSELAKYAQFGHHKDFVAIFLLICVFVKSGLFLFHGTYIGLYSLGFNRLNFVLYAATPLTGYLVLLKTESLLQISHYSYPLMQIFSVASILWGAIGAIVIDHIKEKAVYLSLMFWGLVYAYTAFDSRLENLDFSLLLTASFLLSQILMLIYTAASNETDVSAMGGFLKNLKFTFVLTLLVLMSYFSILINLSAVNAILAWSGVILLLIVSAHIFSQILLGQSHADEKVQAMLKNPSLFLCLPITVATVLICYYCKIAPWMLLLIMTGWLMFFIIRPLRRLDALYENDNLQEADYISMTYDLLIVTPVKIFGRLLWLTVDFVFVERTIINSIQKALNFMISIFQHLHSGTLSAAILFIIFGFLVVSIVWCCGG